MIARTAPKCPDCGQEYRGIYEKRGRNFVGDTFVRWNIEGHRCPAPSTGNMKAPGSKYLTIRYLRSPEGPAHSINKTEKLMETSKATTGNGPESVITITSQITNGIRHPRLGDSIVLHIGDGDQVQNNYGKEMAAVVARVWHDAPPFTINIKGLPDGPGTIWRTSVMHQSGLGLGTAIAQGPSWRWPDEELKRGVAPMEATE